MTVRCVLRTSQRHQTTFTQALHAKGKLQGLDVAGILDAAGRADGAKHTPAAGIDGRPLADYMDFDRASLIDSFHSTSTFLSASNPPATAGKSDSGKTPASSSPKGVVQCACRVSDKGMKTCIAFMFGNCPNDCRP